MWAQILCYKNQGIHWYHCNPTFLWQINFRLVRRLISALIWDISGLWNRSDGRDYREKRIVISRFLALYQWHRLLTPMAISFHKLVLFLRQVCCNFFKNYLNRAYSNASEDQDLSRNFDPWDSEFIDTVSELLT